MSSFVLIITQDQYGEEITTDAQLLTTDSWNSLPTRDKVEIIAMAVHVVQVPTDDAPQTNEELVTLLESGVPITNAEEEIL